MQASLIDRATQAWVQDLPASGERFREFNYLPYGNPHGRYAALERALLVSLLLNWNLARVRSWLRLFSRDVRVRRVNRRLQARSFRFHLRRLLQRVLGQDHESGLVFRSGTRTESAASPRPD
jgi:hypothetical protein